MATRGPLKTALLVAASLAAGCAERPGGPDLGIYGWNASVVDYRPGGSKGGLERLPAAVVLPADRELGPPPHAVILFGREDGPLRAACEALQEGLPHLGSGGETQVPIATSWPDIRATDELTPLDARDCGGLARYYDVGRAQTTLAALGLARADGPVLAGRAAATAEAIVLDLSGLDEADMRRAVSLWRDRITTDPRYWDGGVRVDLVREEIRDLVERYGTAITAAPEIPGG